MKKFKIVLFILLGITIVLVVIGVCRTMYLQSFEEVKESIIEQAYNKIEFDVDTDNINIYLSEENKIEYKDSKNLYVETEVKDNSLLIKRKDEREFYDKMFNFSTYDINLYINVNTIESINVNCDTGNIVINEGFIIENVNIYASTGNIIVKSNVNNNLTINNSTGNIFMKNCIIGSIDIDTSTGNVDLQNVNAKNLNIDISTGNVELINVVLEDNLSIDGSTGNVKLAGFDANNIYITLSTGDVIGTILTSKFFICDSDTGSVNVPKTKEGGECVITVSTGDINISYQEINEPLL